MVLPSRTVSIRFVVLATVIVVLGGCDTSFDAFEETDLVYSVFGVLDAAADTQFVRVEPIRDSTFTGSGELNAHVTSENVETGETIVWNDSTFFVGANDEPVHNFWTAADIAPQSTHRFRVERERDGATATAEVALPPAFAEPETVTNPPVIPQASCGKSAPPTTLQFEGIAHLGAVRTDYDYQVCTCTTPPVCQRRQITAYPLVDAARTRKDTWAVKIFWTEEIPDLEVGFKVVEMYSFRVTVAAASESWPAFVGGDLPGNPTDVPHPPPGEGTNIENGIGFLGGAFTRTVDVPIIEQQ